MTDEIGLYRQLSQLALAAGAAGVTYYLFGGGRLVSAIELITEPSSRLLGICYLVVALGIILFGLQWVIFGFRELAAFEFWIRPSHVRPKSPLLPYVVVVGIGILLGLLIYLIGNIGAFSMTFGIYAVADILLWKLKRKDAVEILSTFRDDLRRHEVGLTGSVESSTSSDRISIYREASLAWESYIFSKPQCELRFFFEVCPAALVFAGVLIGWWPGLFEPALSDAIFIAVGYFLMVGGTLIAELVVWGWRRELYSALTVLSGRLGEQ